ncbi:MAG: hypothetical protein HUJ60_00665 [Bacilli bacterium]|nr:hypothetical protein [Bacilli bacterium]
MITYREAVNHYGSQYRLKRAVEIGDITKIEPGLYSFQEEGEAAQIAARHPKAILTMDTAFYFQDLTDVIPEKWHLATSRTSSRISDPSIQQHFELDRFFGVGVIEKEISGTKLRMYDRERLLIELVRKKADFPYDYYKELIAVYRQISDKLDMYKIENYIEKIKGKRNLYRIIQEEVF